MEAEERLFCAGPLLNEDGDMAGIGLIIYKVASLDEARKIADVDKFHKSGLRTYKIWPMKINEGAIDLKIRFAAGLFDIE